MEVGFSLLSLCHAVSEEPPPFRLAEIATHQHARARRQRSGQAVSREGGRAKRNPGLARARGLLRPVLFVTASEFHGVPFGPAPARLFRQSMRLVMVWLFRCCKRPNGMEVGFSLLSLCHAVSEEPPPFRLVGRATHQHARAHRQRSLQAVSREGGQAKRNPGLARARRLLRPALFVTACEFHGVPFGLVPAGLFR